MSKILDNKYKIGQRVWYCYQGHIPPPNGNYGYKPGLLDIDVISLSNDEIVYADSLDFYSRDTDWYGESELFPTESDAQSRCDELNNRDK